MTALDLAPLLAPIPGPQRAGRWLRYDAVYYDIRKMREAEDPNLPMGVWKHELKRADWIGVESRAREALATQSKDLLLAAWLTEAWLHLRGFAGFTAGMRLMAGLCRDFWSELYPPLDGDSAAARLAVAAWVADKLVLPLKNVAVTAPAGDDSRPMSWSDFERALYYENLERNHAASAAAAYQSGAATHAEFKASASLTPARFYDALAGVLAEARAAVGELDEALDRVAGAYEAPSFAPLREVLDEVMRFVAHNIAAQKASAAAAAEAPAAIAGRDDAVRRLREAAAELLRGGTSDELLSALQPLLGTTKTDEEERMR